MSLIARKPLLVVGHYVEINKIFEHKLMNIFCLLTLTCVVSAQKNRLIETVLLSTHNMFWLRNKKNHF